jgi:hypothetical protein
MPLQMKMVRGGGDMLTIVCDHCGGEITDTRTGGSHYAHDPRDGTPKGIVYFLHYECEPAFTEQGGREEWGWCARDLDCLPVEIALALNIDWQEGTLNELKKKVHSLQSNPD